MGALRLLLENSGLQKSRILGKLVLPQMSFPFRDYVQPAASAGFAFLGLDFLSRLSTAAA